MPFNVQEDLASVSRGIGALEAHLAVSDRLPLRRAEISRWSVGQQLHHTAMVLGLVGTGTRGLLRGRDEGGEPLSGSGLELLVSGVIPRGRVQVPAGLEPEDEPDPEALVALAAKVRKRWDAMADQVAEIEAATGRLPHPLLGPLTATEWVRMAAVHTDHHLAIVADILG